MAGDWIKMRTNLWDDPRVARLCDLTDQSEAAVIGGLYWLWAMADEHTEDGILPGLTLRAIDRKTGVQGLGSALCDIGWLADHPEGVRIIGFEEHNGASAKKRSVTAKRVANHRGNADVTPTKSEYERDVTQQALQDEHASVTGALAREEKRREEENTTTSLRSVVGGARKRSPSFDPAAIDLPDWLDRDLWASWCADRKKRGKPVTEAAAALQLKQLGEYLAAGHQPVSVIEHSIASSYQGLFAPKTITQVTTKAGQQAESFRERDERMARERWEQAAGRAPQHAHIIDITPAEPARLLEIEP